MGVALWGGSVDRPGTRLLGTNLQGFNGLFSNSFISPLHYHSGGDLESTCKARFSLFRYSWYNTMPWSDTIQQEGIEIQTNKDLILRASGLDTNPMSLTCHLLDTVQESLPASCRSLHQTASLAIMP